jgi:phage-related minor tail protein
LGDVLGGAGSQAAGIVPFASGGVIAAPSYFPMPSGGLGLAGEAGPEAIVPLARATDGRLGVSMAGGAPVSISVQIATPDLASFQRSEAYLTGQIARAVARGQRNL